MAVTHTLLLRLVGLLGAVAVLGMLLLWPRGDALPEPPAAGPSTELLDATLVSVDELGPSPEAAALAPDAVDVALTARIEDTGEVVAFTMTDETGGTFAPGQRVRLAAIEQEGLETSYFVSDFRRGRPLTLLVALFLVVVVGFGRVQGVRALLGLALSFGVIVAFIVPAVLAGRPPVVVALVGALAILIFTLYLSHGFGPKTTAALVGTAGALAVTGALALAFVRAAAITGFASEEARLASYQVGGLSLRGLLLAGIIIGGLGVLDDVTMAQSSTVFELRRANPGARRRELVAGALSVGRDHIAATINTLFLAYAGASLPLLILFATGIDPFGTIVTSEVVAVEVVRTLVGSIGLIAAVPLTTALAAAVAVADPGAVAVDAPVGHAHAHVPAAQLEPDEEWEQQLRESYGLRRRDDEQQEP